MSTQYRRNFRRRKGAFDRFMSNQVYGDGSKVLNQEPIEEHLDCKHRWWDSVTGSSPVSPEEAAFRDRRAASLKARRDARKAKLAGTKRPPVKGAGD